MHQLPGVGLSNVQEVYSGPEGQLWELIMGQQVHIGGFASSLELAQAAGITPGTQGVDLCCCTGAGMRFLVRFCNVAGMTGVDATPHVVALGRERCRAEKMEGRVRFVEADVRATGLADACADFVWGEDAWCYVADKPALFAEAVRLVRPGGVVAFTDWIEGPAGLSDEQARRFMSFMKFPSFGAIPDYTLALQKLGCQIIIARDTERFAPYCDLYLDMIGRQLTYDALRIVGFDEAMMKALAQEMDFMRGLARAQRLMQGLFVARRLA